MYKDIVIKKRVWMPEDDSELDAWEIFDEHEEIEFESTIVDFNGRIPIEEGVIVGEWVTDGFKLIRTDCAEILSNGDRIITSEQIEKALNQWGIIEGKLLPTAFYYYRNNIYGIEFSNGEHTTVINAGWFQYIYEGEYEYSLMSNLYGYGLALKRNRLVCGYIQGMSIHNVDTVWERPYNLADAEALTHIQGDPTLP